MLHAQVRRILILFYLFQLLEAQSSYHKKALSVIEEMIPKIKSFMGNIRCAVSFMPFVFADFTNAVVIPVYFMHFKFK